MATYKVLQDIEAEDKLVLGLTLWQFIYALVAGLCIYLSIVSVMNHVAFFLFLLVPVALFVGFLAVPWGGDQPTEVWALAKLRFFLKPRKRLWDQTGMTELVTVTAPKHEVRTYTDGLSQREVNSRLHALASTLDSRGWAVKNVNVSMAAVSPSYSASDRLVDVSSMSQDTPTVDISSTDDMLDEDSNPVAHTFDTMIDEAANEYRAALIERMKKTLPRPPAVADAKSKSKTKHTNSNGTSTNNHTHHAGSATLPPVPDFSLPVLTGFDPLATQQASQSPATFWFTPQPPAEPLIPAAPTSQATPFAPTTTNVPQAATPTADEAALLKQMKARENEQEAAYNHLKTVKTPEQLEADAQLTAARKATEKHHVAPAKKHASAVTAKKQAAIINLSRSNDLNIDTLARQAKQTIASDDDEVVISLR